MTLLHIDSSITGDASVSRAISAAIVERVKANQPVVVTRRDLAASPLAHFTLTPDPANDAVMAEFKAAEVIVLGVPMYNFGIPSQLKAWVDRICVAGQTFRYGPNGPEGLAGGKKVYLAVARGGIYGAGSPSAGFEHAESYLRGVFGFIGITDVTSIVAEGVAMGPEPRQAALDAAIAQAKALA